MKAICPHCHQTIEIAPDVLESLRGHTHFKCPACNGDIEVPTSTTRRTVTLATCPSPIAGPQARGTRAPIGVRGGQTTLASAHRGLNRNLLVLGSLTLLTLGGLGAFIASRNRGNTHVTEQKVTNEIIQNSYFTQLIASGATTKKDLEAITDIRPYGDGFIGISKESLSWDQVQNLATRAGAEVVAMDGASAGSREELLSWLTATYPSHLSTTVWVRELGDARVLDGPDVLSVTTMNRPRKAIFHWRPMSSVAAISTGPPLIDLFDSAQVDGWTQSGPGGIRIENGVGTTWFPADTGGLGIAWYSKRTFADFLMKVEFRGTQAEFNSGLRLRMPPPDGRAVSVDSGGYEIAICDSGDKNASRNPTGSVYDQQSATAMALKAPGEWNALEVRVDGQRYTVTLNGEVVNRFTGSRLPAGYLGLETHNRGPVQFRKLFIRDLESEDSSSEPDPASPLVFGDSRYEFVRGVLSWKDAMAAAELRGGHLAAITSAAEDAWVVRTFAPELAGGKQFWIGGFQSAPDQPWEWVTGEMFDYVQWAPFEPNNAKSTGGKEIPPYMLTYLIQGGRMGWNDQSESWAPWHTTMSGYLVEWSKPSLDK